jgi:hypothetical protein
MRVNVRRAVFALVTAATIVALALGGTANWPHA